MYEVKLIVRSKKVCWYTGDLPKKYELRLLLNKIFFNSISFVPKSIRHTENSSIKLKL